MFEVTEYDILDLSEFRDQSLSRDISIHCTNDMSVEITGETDTLLLSAEANDILMERSTHPRLLTE